MTSADFPSLAAADPRFPYSGPAELGHRITAALEQVVDPEVALSVVDLGLIRDIAVHPDLSTVSVTMTMTSAACPATELIVGDVESELDRVLPAGMRIDVVLVWEPAWTADRVSPRGKVFMGWP